MHVRHDPTTPVFYFASNDQSTYATSNNRLKQVLAGAARLGKNLLLFLATLHVFLLKFVQNVQTLSQVLEVAVGVDLLEQRHLARHLVYLVELLQAAVVPGSP